MPMTTVRGPVAGCVLTLASVLVLVSGPNADAQATPRMIVVLDPSCATALAFLDRVAEFRRVHAEIPIRFLVPKLGAFGHAPPEILQRLQQAHITFEWDPGVLRTLGVTRTPTVVVVNGQGHGVWAAGTPDLTALIRAVPPR